jgi:antitoxin component YwqK of YwqJK toxin-antitoxin module
MKLFKKSIKILCVVFGLILLFVVAVLMGESYEVISKANNGLDTKVEVKKFFGKKLSETTINSKGFYNGEFKSWHIFKKNMIRVEGQFKNGFLHGYQKDYNRDGMVMMKRIWDEGKLSKLYMPENGILKEIPEDKWPEYARNPHTRLLKAKGY